jgi:hypothetical protein
MEQAADALFDLKEAAAARASGGIVSAELRTTGGAFYVAFEMQGGGWAELVKANGRERRLFRDAGAALKVVSELGITRGRFSLEGWDTRAPKLPAWKRPDKAMDMRERHRRASESMREEAGLIEARGGGESSPLASDASGTVSSSRRGAARSQRT